MNQDARDLWAVWPDGYMCPMEEVEETLSYRSDNYEVVEVTEYDEIWTPYT